MTSVRVVWQTPENPNGIILGKAKERANWVTFSCEKKITMITEIFIFIYVFSNVLLLFILPLNPLAMCLFFQLKGNMEQMGKKLCHGNYYHPAPS